MSSNQEIQFIHANGFPPSSYAPLLNLINNKFTINHFKLRPLLENSNPEEIKNWIPFQNDYIKSLNDKNDKVISIGHSIGGNIALRSCISNPEYFSKVVLIDPTLFTPRIIFFWKMSLFLKIHKYIHPWVKATLKRKMKYPSYESIFNSYRKKNVFKKINDSNLSIYIKSITKTNDDGSLKITYPKEWEYQIYKTGLIADNYIWKNIKNITLPVLIIRSKSSNAFLEPAANKIKKLNKKINIVTLDNTTHLFPLEIPKKTAALINDFLIN